jgi:ABC-type Fe3+ transport system permease subunit
MLAIEYNWWKLLHVLGVLAFVMYHGVSMIVALRLRKERDRARIAELLQFSGSSVRGMYLSLAWLTVFGVIAGVQSGVYTHQGWFWVSLGVLVFVMVEMGAMARPYYQRLKEAVEIRPSGVPRRSDEELDTMLRSRLPLLNTALGFAALLFIAYLMIFKPF